MMFSDFYKKFFFKKPIPNLDYDVLLNLKEDEYPKYLKLLYEQKMGEKLNLKNPKTFTEKLQWLKIYDCSKLRTELTDKVLVRNWVAEKIGKEYLKPMLQIHDRFDEINFDILPEKIIIKTNHGCHWNYKTKEKSKFLASDKVKAFVKEKFDTWIKMNFFAIGGLEQQYKDIIPKILVEPLMIDETESYANEIGIYTFNGIPRLMQKSKFCEPITVCLYNEAYEEVDFNLCPYFLKISEPFDNLIKKAAELSKKLAQDFKFVRVDWLVYHGKIYFNEMTFTPSSGYIKFPKQLKKYNRILGNALKL